MKSQKSQKSPRAREVTREGIQIRHPGAVKPMNALYQPEERVEPVGGSAFITVDDDSSRATTGAALRRPNMPAWHSRLEGPLTPPQWAAGQRRSGSCASPAQAWLLDWRAWATAVVPCDSLHQSSTRYSTRYYEHSAQFRYFLLAPSPHNTRREKRPGPRRQPHAGRDIVDEYENGICSVVWGEDPVGVPRGITSQLSPTRYHHAIILCMEYAWSWAGELAGELARGR
ncbi:hypothetical protein G7Z17_g3302 [Cylindrodendrum hubeiense]|uniref:Uncharacterized protein n=1 Tax=Cylindrodendrum hubeiense TaxID=595255 RepID=A0A9P5LDP6_9HYPO|nr:hypothetical protein G7Z17_g3302 [Cylindrodendrum hubeiense]